MAAHGGAYRGTNPRPPVNPAARLLMHLVDCFNNYCRPYQTYMPILAARVYHDQYRVFLVYWGSSGRIQLFVYRPWLKLPYSRSQLL